MRPIKTATKNKQKYFNVLPREFAVSVVDELGLLLGQGVDAVAKSKERSVDVSTFLQSYPRILRTIFNIILEPFKNKYYTLVFAALSLPAKSIIYNLNKVS